MGWDGPNLVFRDGTPSLLYLLTGWSGHSFLFDRRDKGEWDGWRIRHRCALFVINETHVLISRPHYFSFIYKKNSFHGPGGTAASPPRGPRTSSLERSTALCRSSTTGRTRTPQPQAPGWRPQELRCHAGARRLHDVRPIRSGPMTYSRHVYQ